MQRAGRRKTYWTLDVESWQLSSRPLGRRPRCTVLTYRVRPRSFKFDGGKLPSLPALARVAFQLAPDQAFGCSPTGGRTAVKAVAATTTFNTTTGQYFVESAESLSPLTLSFLEGPHTVTLTGTELVVQREITNPSQLKHLVRATYFMLPLLLAPYFADPPLIVRVDGTLGTLAFRWQLSSWVMQLNTTTQDKQQALVEQAWRRIPALAAPAQRRLAAALHYFHVACRLNRVAETAGEFLSESLLNFAKILQVLFQTDRGQARSGLARLGFSLEEIERDFIPAMLLRDQIDVAHVSLALFSQQQLTVLHRYSDRAEDQFRTLLQRCLQGLDAGTLQFPPYELRGADAETARTIETLATALASLGDKP